MLTAIQRAEYYQRWGFSEQVIARLEYERAHSPFRDVGKSARNNMVVHLQSATMGRMLKCESRGAEALAFMSLELTGEALEIYPQVEMRRVKRPNTAGRLVVSGNITCDALLFTEDGVVYLEVKNQDELERLSRKKPHEWVKTDTGWTRPAAERWAQERGCHYRIWSPPVPGCYYQANVELIHPRLREPEPPAASDVLQRASKELAKGPKTLEQLLQWLPGGAVDSVLWLIAHRKLFATLRSGTLDTPESVSICLDQSQCEQIDSAQLAVLLRGLAPLAVTDPLLEASSTDMEHGRRRLERVERMISGDEPTTRAYRALVKKVKRARAEGETGLRECLTNYRRSGNRQSRLDEQHPEIMEAVVKRYWDTGLKERAGVHEELDKACSARGIETPAICTLNRLIRRRSISSRASATGGNRQYHATRPATDPSQRSIAPLARFQIVHIDSTKFDHRSAADTLPDLPFSCPWLFTAIDAKTGEPLGRSISLGIASRFGLGQLLRDIVGRHGRLPAMIIADRGSECWSRMMISFAQQYGITLVMRPAGAPTFGREIEVALREINRNTAHQLVGSTLPDQKGRNVDGKYKSYNTARLGFSTVHGVVDSFMFDIFYDRPIGHLGLTPREAIEHSMQLEPAGRKVALDDELILATSVPAERATRIRDRKTLYCYYREYTSASLPELISTLGRPEQFRLDCANPYMAYARYAGKWHRLLSTKAMELAVHDELDRIFASVYTRDLARRNRKLKESASRKAADLAAIANASAPLFRDPGAAPNPISESATVPPERTPSISGNWDNLPVTVEPAEEYDELTSYN